MPALIIGIGQTGREVLQQVHQALRARFGSRQAVAHVRLLYVDTDADAIHAVTEGGEAAGLPPEEVMPVRLNRPSHYLKPRDGRPPIDTWCNSAMLYRIRRSQRTEGMRALGRLAFLDHYRVLDQRLRAEIQACCDPDLLAAAREATGLALRSNQPRIWVIAGLAGGTGGGMFLDFGYTLRSLLRKLGYPDAETLGLLLLPPLTKATDATMALGNAFAALTELNHFAAPENTFVARYDTREPAIVDAGPPFTRCTIVPTPENTDDRAALAGMLGQVVYRALTTPLGRVADTERVQRQAHAEAATDGSLRVSSIGLARLRRERQRVLRQAERPLLSADHQVAGSPRTASPSRPRFRPWSRNDGPG